MTLSNRASPYLVTTKWLEDHLHEAGLVVLDGSFKLPGTSPSAADDYANSHISGARFFDIDKIADRGTSLPHMLPTAVEFERHVREMGISNSTRIVVYDGPGLMSAGRVWWTFRTFGHERIAILDGGLRKWIREGRATTNCVPAPTMGSFNARFRRDLVRNKVDLLANLDSALEQVVDARTSARFQATELEFRPGLRSGHIPGSRNVPFGMLTHGVTGELRSVDDIRTIFKIAGVDVSRPVIATCGSGVTAGALAFALHVVGVKQVAIYDGAWAEWGVMGDTPVEPAPRL